ncbi:NRDE family protein [Polynucleobacter sp. AP-Titi-500A-B4]|uniref:NRDE family protein n=1 Tax=Polynucleobacter sp. AP-Titi-500A-B4 TaxID=2576923 RepID=UPI001BFED8D6|nr:NRDE family protein [Polynucleobacter sp. AP-Titi-500A-B4]QWE13451.1 NRDE family protein [Polynucleobacter sp. AP-Titi-500A-B4]
MCLILFAWNSHPDYSLVVAANRDEFYERDTAGIAYWPEHPHVLAGRDRADVLGSPGTWLGFTKTGKFAALTNVRAPSEKNPDARTRGELSLKYLTSKDKPAEFMQENSKSFNHYNGFNLLMADLSDPANAEMHWVSNRMMMGQNIRPRKVFPHQPLDPGVYGLSNAMLDTPWPKVNHRIAAFAQVLAMDHGQLKSADQYLKVLADTHHASDHELPNTGVSREWEKALSPAFIKTPSYGTRSSTVLRVRKDGNFEMVERRFDATGAVGHDVITGALSTAPGSNLSV